MPCAGGFRLPVASPPDSKPDPGEWNGMGEAEGKVAVAVVNE